MQLALSGPPVTVWWWSGGGNPLLLSLSPLLLSLSPLLSDVASLLLSSLLLCDIVSSLYDGGVGLVGSIKSLVK